ncbi:MAG: GtrA family protein, partial [Desulfosporosinus sp.]|nr:GtrA family protein [Desulfosporosinus sp.]
HSLSYTCGGLNSFLLNKKWTFKQGGGHTSGQLPKFLLLNLLTMMITYCLLVGIYNYLAWPLIVCKLVVTGASLVINYIGSRLWIFSSISELNGVV